VINTESLRKILELEHQKGYQDSAVIGGLDQLLRNWASQAAASLNQPKLLKRFQGLKLAKSRYASLTKPGRKEWVQNLLDFLAELEQGPLAKSEAKPPPIRRQAAASHQPTAVKATGKRGQPVHRGGHHRYSRD